MGLVLSFLIFNFAMDLHADTCSFVTAKVEAEEGEEHLVGIEPMEKNAAVSVALGFPESVYEGVFVNGTAFSETAKNVIPNDWQSSVFVGKSQDLKTNIIQFKSTALGKGDTKTQQGYLLLDEKLQPFYAVVENRYFDHSHLNETNETEAKSFIHTYVCDEFIIH